MEENARQFDHRINTPEPHIVAILASIDEAKGVFRTGARMTPQTIDTLRKSVIVTSAGASTRIEGSKLSDEEVKKIMRGQKIQKFEDRDSQEVQGYLETLENIFDSYATLPLREGMIKSLHKELLKYSTKDDLHRGDYKHKENMVGVLSKEGEIERILFETTPSFLTSKEMSEIVAWTTEAIEKERYHPLLIIANFIIEFLKIHPFEDGNGRLSRILTNLLLLRAGYTFVEYVSHEQIVEQRKEQYYLALRASQQTFRTQKEPVGDEETIAPWLNFFLSAIQEQSRRAMALVEEDMHDNTLSAKQLQVLEYFAGAVEGSAIEIAAATGVTHSTVRKALDRLIEIGKIKRIGRGRATRYVKA